MSRFVPGTESNYYWDPNSTSWQFSDTTNYTYNSAGQQTSRTIVREIGPLYRELTTYNNISLQTEKIGQVRNSSTLAWENTSKYTTTYDAQGYEILAETFSWENNTWKLNNSSKTIISYNTSQQVTQVVYQTYIPNTAQYENYYRVQYNYNISGQLNDYTGAMWNNGLWDNNYRAFNIVWYQWNNSLDKSKLQAFTSQHWYNASWETYERHTITYDSNGSSITIIESYQNNVWLNQNRVSKVYNSLLDFIEEKDDTWDGSSWVQMDGYRHLLSYDAENRQTQNITQVYSGFNMQYENQHKSVFSNFTAVTAAPVLLASEVTTVVSPNPFTSSASITINNLKHNSSAELLIIDVNGKVVKRLQNIGTTTTLNREGLSSGMYFYHIQQNGQKIAAGKLSIQ